MTGSMAEEEQYELSARAMQRLSGLDDYAFIRLCYNAILDREPDPAGMSAQLGALGDGRSRIDIIGMLLDSPEFAVRNPDMGAKDRVLFFDAGGYLNPTLRNLLNAVAARLDADRLFCDARAAG